MKLKSVASGYTSSQIYFSPSYLFWVCSIYFLPFFFLPVSSMFIKEINSLSPDALFSAKQNFWQTKMFYSFLKVRSSL